MRVAILTANARAGDAIGNQVAEKTAYFRERGADVVVFAESTQKIHPVIRPCCHSFDPLRADEEGWEFLLSADLIIVEYGQYFGLLEILPLLAGKKARIVFDYHGVTPAEHWGPNTPEAIAKGSRQCGLVWCADGAVMHSHFARQELITATSFPKEWCYTVPLAVDTAVFRPGIPIRHLSDRLQTGPATWLLFVGRLALNKRVPILLEALALLHELEPPVHLAIVGDIDDIYALEKTRCEQRAAGLGLARQVHFLGHVSEECLLDAYRSADLVVMPSVHEGFCLPVLEAFACGMPVVAARAAALPETLGGAGLLFSPDDPVDLAKQIRRVLANKIAAPSSRLRVAIVAYRYGTDFVGGAESSLRIMAHALHRAGHHVEVFTTTTKNGSRWADQCRESTVTTEEFPVHRFRIDAHDPVAFQDAIRGLRLNGKVPGRQSCSREPIAENAQREFLRHSLHASTLIKALQERCAEWDAIITGPYLSGLAADIAGEFAEKTILVPCFHDEPLARLAIWRQVYGAVAGMWFHSPEEKTLAEIELGISVPGSVCVGTLLEHDKPGDPERGRKIVGTGNRFLLYCGRYSAEKGLAKLLAFARRYVADHPERFIWAFMGHGEVPIPKDPWARDLGFVDEIVKRDVMAGAEALVQLSPNESLSLVALEAWLHGTPVVADADCPVLAGHLQRSGGGQTITSYASFAAVIDTIWQHPQKWRSLGQKGRTYVREQYTSSDVFTGTLVSAIQELHLPLRQRMRRRGLERATDCSKPQIRDRFTQILQEIMDQPSRPFHWHLEIQARSASRTFSGKEGTILIPVRITNSGSHPVLAQGPGRCMLGSRVVDHDGKPCGKEQQVGMPALLIPGQMAPAAIPVEVPVVAGNYQVIFSCASAILKSATAQAGQMELIVAGDFVESSDASGSSFFSAARASLAEAHKRHLLPDNYLDVTQGLFAGFKAWLKRKILRNFKHAYVDVLSRQQTEFNQLILTALQELTEYGATLEHMLALERDKRQKLEKRLQQLAENADLPSREENACLQGEIDGRRPPPARHSHSCLRD